MKQSDKRAVEGEILYWLVIDPETYEAVLRVPNRTLAREFAHAGEGLVAKVVMSR